MARVLVTGAAGFVGRFAVRHFLAHGWDVTAAARTVPADAELGATWQSVGDISAPDAWRNVVQGADCVVHAAARVHVTGAKEGDSLGRFRAVNVEPTARLARAAAAAGVKRFIFLSSIGVNGHLTTTQPFRERDEPQPHSAYALSKWEAEQALRKTARESGLEFVILRLPLIYGPGAPGNFSRLAKWVQRGMPLPFGAIHNRRSLLFIENLTDVIMCCAKHAAAANELFLVSDAEAVSTPELITSVAAGLGCHPRLWPIPEAILRAAERASCGRLPLQPLLNSLEIDCTYIRHRLGWTPPYSLKEGLKRTFSCFP